MTSCLGPEDHEKGGDELVAIMNISRQKKRDMRESFARSLSHRSKNSIVGRNLFAFRSASLLSVLEITQTRTDTNGATTERTTIKKKQLSTFTDENFLS